MRCSKLRGRGVMTDVVDISDEEVVARFPTREVTHETKNFYKGWLQKRLLLNRCSACGRWHHPGLPICPACWSSEIVPTDVSGRGTVHLLTLLHQGPPAEGVDYAEPYPVAGVELEEQEGLRYTSAVVNCSADSVAIGMNVELTWIERHGAPFPVFQPAGKDSNEEGRSQ